jgi:hypothetical protein
MKASVMVFALGFALAAGAGSASANIELEFPDADENGPEYTGAAMKPRLIAAPVEIVLVPMNAPVEEPEAARAAPDGEPTELEFPDADENGP